MDKHNHFGRHGRGHEGRWSEQAGEGEGNTDNPFAAHHRGGFPFGGPRHFGRGGGEGRPPFFGPGAFGFGRRGGFGRGPFGPGGFGPGFGPGFGHGFGPGPRGPWGHGHGHGHGHGPWGEPSQAEQIARLEWAKARLESRLAHVNQALEQLRAQKSGETAKVTNQAPTTEL